MDLEYDRKFEEMKQYIPFLESMIKRLESTNDGVKNPRKAQLDKIRSLRDLLLDKKKRMKMENLLKCEQVLVNLYAKVEQRDSIVDNKEDCTEKNQTDKSDLNMVRNKLKSVASKLQDDVPETLPEIARATNTEVVCTPGSKEPALFQRRPNKASPVRRLSGSHKDDHSNSKRHYTRVLMSPDHKKKDWLVNSQTNNDTPLFSRRSPRRSPRRHSPSYKRERKKSSKQRSKSSQDSKDLNITLKVPEESLGTLNTKDILSRIINCSDSDVDIDTLRGLRSQILGELKQTGTKDDISDLILKSYKKKEKSSKKSDEVEEGELSDSESETIENIYGSLVVVDKSESDSNSNKVSSDKKQPRKIQICLVINSEKEKEGKSNEQTLNTTLDISDFEAYTDSSSAGNASSRVSEGDKAKKESISKEVIEKEYNIALEEKNNTVNIVEERCKSPKQDNKKIEKPETSSKENPNTLSTETFKPNFYQSSMEEQKNTEECFMSKNCNKSLNEVIDEKREVSAKPAEVVKNPVSKKRQTKTRAEVVSEIDILQALKKEILGETGTVPIPEVITPPLHQPKITKVASANEIMSKKRISIENYKQKSVPSIKQPLFKSVKQQSSIKDDNLKKQSLKLTEKECERFNFPVNVSPVDSSEDEDKQKWDHELLHGAPKSPDSTNKEKSPLNYEVLRGGSAPKSPDHEDFADTGIRPPVIIPSDPVKNVAPNTKVDIDMRTLMPLISPVSLDASRKGISSPSVNCEKVHETTWNENTSNNEKIRKSVPEFRMRAESNQSTAKNSPNSFVADSDRGQRSGVGYTNLPANISSNIPPLMSLNPNPNIISNLNQIMQPILNSPIPLLLNPNMTPNMTPTLNPLLVSSMNPNMTPSRMIPGMNPMMTPIVTPNSRTYEMTPRPNFDVDDYTNQKHVYAPMFPPFESHDFLEKDSIQVNQSNESSMWEDRNCRSTSVQRDVDYHRNRNDRYAGDKRLDSPQIRMECPATPNPSFGRMECPPTPNASFGRMECPPTPNASFGRMECPSTPNASFGRMECPSTPNPSFGRMETPMTPVHSFGRSDCPITPSHPFGRSDTNMTPTNVFGRDYHPSTSSYNHNYIKSHDPRLNRSNDYDKCHSRSYDERNQSYFEDDHKMTDNVNRYRRNHVKPYEQDTHNNRGRMLRRESSVGRSVSRDYETDESYNEYRYRRENYQCSDDISNERNYRSKSIGRINSPLRERGKTYTKEDSMEKPISVQSHTGRSFNIDTSFNRTFQETKSTSLDKSFNARRQRASSVGRSLRESPRKDSIERISTKNDCFQILERKTTQFRRACSVGRDLKDYNANKNFKDIKDDLRSYKFDNYDFNQRGHKSKSHSSYSSEKVGSKGHHSRRDTHNRNSTLNKSSGHPNNRDPRRKLRDYDMNSTKIDESSKYSPRKNFRDPRMRREIDAKNTITDRYKDKERNSSNSRYKNNGIVYSNDNIAKGTILASVSGVKNFKIPKIKRAVEEKEIENKSQSEIDIKKKESSKNVKNAGNSNPEQTKKIENKPSRLESASNEVDDYSKNIAIKVDKPKSKEDNKLPDKGQNLDENTLSDNIISDSCERRITRSAVKGGTPSKQISSTSPIKKLKRIKKPLVYDSDSDTQENESSNKNMKKTSIDKLKINEERKLEKGSKIKNNDETMPSELSSSTNEDTIPTYTSIENNVLNNIKENTVPDTTKESPEGQNDTLDISFGVDDDLFSDNMASGSVLDNINALIADLDHDIEAPKINDFNDKFINNIVGTVSSNNSPLSLNGNRTDFASDVVLHDDVGSIDDVENTVKGCDTQILNSKEEENKIEAKKSENNSGHENCLNQSNETGTQSKCEEIKKNEAKNVEPSKTETTNKPVLRENVTGTTGANQGGIKNLNFDAIVSTTARDDLSNKLQFSSNNTITCGSLFESDSSINSCTTKTNVNNKDLQESVPDSTNELASEMNVSSTNNSSDLPPKEQSANSTCVDSHPRIDSISKLLSILEDKNKIKELLTFLSTDTGENEKIKKKLEKLSEIVSDEEDSTKDANCDNKTKSQRLNEENVRKSDDIVDGESENDDNSKSIDADHELHKDSNEGESISVKTALNDTAIKCYNENAKNECTSKNDDEIAKICKENQLQTDIESVENKNISVDVVQNTTNSIVDKEAEVNETFTKCKEVTDTVQEDTQISEVNVKENNMTDILPAELKSGKKNVKKTKITKRGRSKLAKNYLLNNDKRVTRSEAGSSQPIIPPAPKKPSRELLKLQEDIRDMFISEDILNATGIRMCRLAKLVDNKNSKEETSATEVEPEPIVVLENIKNKMPSDDSIKSIEKNKRKTKNKPNILNDVLVDSELKQIPKYKPGPKSKTKKQDDPYIFETESIGESNNTIDSKEQNTDSDSDSVSTKSFESAELSVELKKKPKRKRRSWQLGVIKKKGIKGKSAVKSTEFIIRGAEEIDAQESKDKNTKEFPDYNCFTDKSYCFYKNVKNYMCRLCGYRGNDIVPHYKKQHPHSEIPLSRLSPGVAKEAIQQCENMNLQAISKIQTLKYVCRFCFQVFHKQNTVLETFFWHVVSMHTGEFKHLCSECINITRCPFNLDIPPPPKNVKGQLIGYICGRCNFTQVSLENLKTHVIIRHDDEQTEVYSINLGDIPRKILESLITKANESPVEEPRVLRSSRSNQSITEPSDRSDITDSTDHIDSLDIGRANPIQDNINKVPSKVAPQNKIQSKFIFENDDSDASSYSKNDEMIKASIKLERDEDTQDSVQNDVTEEALQLNKERVPDPQPPIIDNAENVTVLTELTSSSDVLDYPHFKIKLSNTGAKEYVCCINGVDNHYKTTLLISLKKHVQFKHSENWDGYCFVCKVIVTGQGKHTFNDCLQHFLVKHMDNFPIFEEAPESIVDDVPVQTTSTLDKEATISKTYINVRPLSELISTEQNETREVNPTLPKIQIVTSLGSSDVPINTETVKDVKVIKYEEAQSEVMAKKHRVVLEAMLSPEKLIQVFKCAGRFCSYTTDNAEEALLHASTHERIGGESSLKCAYCDFDSSGNAIDLVMHVFKNYNHCSYACSKCFYRAAGSHLVYAHIKRIHTEFDPDKVPVLSSGTVVKDNTPDDLISRDEAVMYYICNNKDTDEGGVCKFKSYVLTKFREHLQTRHPNDQEYSCYMCNITVSSSKLLGQHLKSHGLRIYQCCRCLFGAENEPELMAHASEKHPLKQPKAYLRIITSKGGGSEVRVLPLAVLSKPSVEATVVTPCVNKESPVKQAERSIDLEKLIGLTNLTVESMSTITNETTIEPLEITANAKQIQLESEQTCESSQAEAGRSSPAVLTLLRDTQSTLREQNVKVKSEPVEIENSTSEISLVTPISAQSAQSQPDVVCLDSDDDSSLPKQNIIDLSLEDTPVEINSTGKQEDTNIKIPRTRLYKCSKCLLVSKSEGMFKRHMLSCFPDPHEIIKCAHCSYTTAANEILLHYNSNHVESALLYTCGLCEEKFISLPVVRKHMKITHSENSIIVKSKTSPTGTLHYIVEKDFKERQTFKRKLSGDTTHRNSEPASKLKKYGPLDVDKLPINPILDDLVYCALCEFSTKVRLNMVRHLQFHAEQQPVPRTAPVNPVPHLESNEKHFDKMVNLASSSITTSNKAGKDVTATTFEYLSPEAAMKYPKYVPDKHRYTCGAKGCSYISVNETMFKIHWETLHAGTNDYHCVHCLPHQQLNTTKPLTAVRIIAHLKMHDVKLYACSTCTLYHYTRKYIDKHLKDVHPGKVVIVREDGAPLPPTPPPAVQAAPAPTMDLKPWQCGLCKFKSMIRPEVIEHCGKYHQSKMQFKCLYCGFRTSNIENISKHQSKQHPGKKEEVFYFYYREGSIPDEADGTARWQKQSQKTESEIKVETDIPPPETVPILPQPAQAKPPNLVNLDIVKKEVVEPDNNVSSENSDENLCQTFGQFCDPNGLKYKCPLCKVIIEDTKEAMQSHLYEELQYRKWGCAVCSYKAFHKPGLQQHVQTEHRHSREAREPIELQVNFRIEAWVTKLLEHQTGIIERNKANLAKQKAEILRSIPGTSKVAEKPVESPASATKPNTTMAELEKLFGPFGVPNNLNYTCPKCNINARAEAVMQEHLEGELNKIRWCCNICSDTFQTYHEAQFHCRSVHAGQSSRPVEAPRDVGLRAAWVAAVLRVQKLSMNFMPVTDTPTPDIPAPQTDISAENSLLVVRYEEKVPTPEELMKLNKKADKDEGKTATDDAEKKKAEFECEHCLATYKQESFFQSHVLKHYGLKPFTCPYCPHTDHKKMMESHIRSQHPNRTVLYVATSIPTNPPVHDYLKSPSANKTVVIDIESKIICLGCEEAMTRAESQTHFHDKVRPQFGMRGAVVYRCWTCLTLHKTSNDFNVHHKQFHPSEKKNSSFYKLSDDSRSLFCSLCNQNFVNMTQYRSHQQMKHGLKSYESTDPPVPDVVIELDDEVEGVKRKAVDTTILPVPKRVARKSTTKLPTTIAVARKSTTKLPFNVPCDDEEYSFYGSRPSMDNLENVTTLMPFYNTFVPFTLQKLSEIIKIYPVVVVKDINKQ